MELVELGALSEAQYAELVGDEQDPWDAAGSDVQWRPKDRYVAVRGHDGKLLAAAGLLVVDVQSGDQQPIPVVGIGGVIVAAPHRGRGLGQLVISEAIKRAHDLGPEIAMLVCSSPHPPQLELARALTDLGALQRRVGSLGRRAEARNPLLRALELADRAGATPLAERAHVELLAAGARPPPNRVDRPGRAHQRRTTRRRPRNPGPHRRSRF